ncbi:MAG: FIG01024279: hypothetical protein, partial [uncultured Friedmanniella sp.]
GQAAVRHLPGPVPPCRGEPHAGPAAGPRAGGAPRPAGLRRGLDRRAPLGGQRDHRLAGDLHRRRRRAHQADQAGHRRHLDHLPQPALGGRAHGDAGPPDPRPGDARLRPGLAAHRLDDARAGPDRHPRAAAGRPGHHHAAAARRDRHRDDQDPHPGRRPAAPAALHPAALRDRGRRRRLTHRAADGRHARHRAAVHRGHAEQGRLRRPRPPLERRTGAGRGAREVRRPVGLAAGRADARRRDPGAGLPGRRARHRGLVPVLPEDGGLPADGGRGRRRQGDDRLHQRGRHRRDRHGRG